MECLGGARHERDASPRQRPWGPLVLRGKWESPLSPKRERVGPGCLVETLGVRSKSAKGERVRACD